MSVRPAALCGPDPVSETDAATNAFRKISPKVVPDRTAQRTRPRRGTEVTFSWEDYRTTNAGVTYFGGASPSHQSAQRYRLQVAQSATITDGNAIDDVTVDQTTYTASRPHVPRGRPVVASAGDRQRRQPAGVVGHPQVRQELACCSTSTTP